MLLCIETLKKGVIKMKFNLAITFLWMMAVLYITTTGSQTVYYVDAINGNDSNTGTSWSSAKATIGAALGLVADGDTVHIAEGNYPECLTLPANVTLLGGFPSGGGARDPQAHETIIDGQQQGTVVTTLLNSNDLLDGFTITGGQAGKGGGIYALGSSVFRNLKVVNNQADLGGGLLCAQDVTIEDCQIMNNRAAVAPAIAIIGGSTIKDSITVRKNDIRHNVTTSQGLSGGAVFVTLHLNLDFSYNLVAENSAPDGGVFIEESFGEKTLDHNTITRNGNCGLTLKNAFTVLVTNSIIYDHALADVELRVDTLSTVKLRYSDIGTISGPHQAEQLMSLDPQFTDPEAGDYTLKATSPAIAAGDPMTPLEGAGMNADLGAFPYLQQSAQVRSPWRARDQFRTGSDLPRSHYEVR